jgi:hypothetical protein
VEGDLMVALNTPTGGVDGRPEDKQDDWSPAIGMRRAVLRACVVALIIGASLFPVDVYLPAVLLNFWIRLAVSFGTAWILFRVVQGAAGMVGWPCTALAVGLSLLVLLSNHVAFAVFGVPTRAGVVYGWTWLHPATLLGCNVSSLIGVTFCAVMCHSGAAIGGTIVDLLMQNPLWWGTRR